MAADSKRQKIVDAIDTQLKTILITGGYKTDAGKNVFEWRDPAIEELTIPCLVWRDTEDEISAIDNSLEDHRLVLEVDAIATGTTATANFRKMIADVIRAVGLNQTWGGLAIDTRPISITMQTEQAVKRFSGGTYSFEVRFRTNIFDAYT